MVKSYIKIFYIIFVIIFFVPNTANAQRAELLKMSPTVRQIVIQNSTVNSKGLIAPKCQDNSKLIAFVKADGDVFDVMKSNGCEVIETFGDILIAKMPIKNIIGIASDKRIKKIEAKIGNSINNAETKQILNATPVYQGQNLPQAFTGLGVIMGVQDIGFDLINPNFYSTDMTNYRIKVLWDMVTVDTLGSRMPVGNEYTNKTSLLNHAHSYDGLIANHGSHTLGTAAGSGYGTNYGGIAYDSDICLVSNATSEDIDLIPEENRYKYTSATDALGFKYIFDYATSVGKPCVISFSEGSHQDLYGDDLLYYDVLKQLVGPGRIIVASAGNNNQVPSYFQKQPGVDKAGTFMEIWGNQFYFMSQSDKPFTTRMIVYGSESDTLSISSEWLCQQTDSLAFDTINVDGNDYYFIYGAYKSAYDPNKLVVEYVVTGPEHIGMSSVCPFSVEFIGNEAEIEVYKVKGNFVSRTINPELNDGERTHDINSPSSSPDVISVGATAYSTGYTNMSGKQITYNYGTNGTKASFSSVGPTIDGRLKPDVVAPGTNIISSTNSFFFENNPESLQVSDIVSNYVYNGRTYYWKADTGTSMSSPAVGGAIALWLQAKPDLTRDEIINVFANTCTHPDPSLTYPNSLYGYGQIDIYKGLLYILGIDGIEDISKQQPENVKFEVHSNKTFTVRFDNQLTSNAKIRVYGVSGQLIREVIAPKGTDAVGVQLPYTSSGVFAIQVVGDRPSSTGSTLIRF